MSQWRQARAAVVLPGSATIVVPVAILLAVEGANVGWGLGAPIALLIGMAGIALIASGFSIWLWTVRLFSRIGRGTLAPWDPTSRLVVAGPYRHVRNPMICGVAAALAGEAILLGSVWIVAWMGVFLAINFAFFLLFEEPGLERRFGQEYRSYKHNVPRWVPRRTPWSGG